MQSTKLKTCTVIEPSGSDNFQHVGPFGKNQLTITINLLDGMTCHSFSLLVGLTRCVVQYKAKKL